ncbi:MAG: hypothetical protein ACE363_00930 [Alphaproteobacteria bacterium]
MILEELKTLIDAYGGDPSRWPDDRRGAAEALVASSREAQALVAEARQLDGLLEQVAPAEPSTALLSAIGAIPDQVKQDRPQQQASTMGSTGWGFSLRRAFAPMLGAAAALLLGFYVGTLNVVPVEAPFQVADAEVVDLADYVFGEDLPEGMEL